MNKRLIKLGLDSYMLNYLHNEKPRRYFLSAHADEDDLQKFAELIVRECADVAFLEANSRKTQRAVLQHFGIKE